MVSRKEIIVTSLDGGFVAVAAEEASEYFHGMIKLNETGAFITECFKTPSSFEEVAKLVCEKYNVEYEKAYNDVKKIADAYIGAGLLLE